MKFKRYSESENAYRTKYIMTVQDSINMGYCENDFVVEEKVHGANFAFYYDGNEVKMAKRSSFLQGDGSSFYNAHLIYPEYSLKMVLIEGYINGYLIENKLIPNINSLKIQVAGEIFGGNYPDVEGTHKGVSKVQKGIDYNPNIDFYAFDVLWTTDEDEKWNVIDKDIANEMLKKAGFFYAKFLFRGTFEECLNYPNEFKSTIPNQLGLPEHPEANICEGVVIKPVKYATTGNGKRIIIKNKNEKWSEKSNESKKPRGPKTPTKLSDKGKKISDTLVSHVTENRLKNVLSKWEGDVTQKDFGRLMNLFTEDALKDFNKDYLEDFESLEKSEIKVIKKYFGTKSAEIIRKNFLNIMDKIF